MMQLSVINQSVNQSPYPWKAFETRRMFFGIWSTEEIRCEKCDPQNWGMKSLKSEQKSKQKIMMKPIYKNNDETNL